MDLIVTGPNTAHWGKNYFHCAIGRTGIIAANLKHEGDGKTPVGRWAMRDVFYRADRLTKPQTSLPTRALDPDDGWCEIPDDPNYNRLVRHPYPGTDRLWRDDHIYDIIVVLGYNDRPVKTGLGSAIFLHMARPDYSPTAGCIALQLADLLTVLREATPESHVAVKAF